MMDGERLIFAVQSRSVIFDKGDKNHHNRNIVSTAWESIAKEVGSDAIACKNRWGTLRDYFLKKYRESRTMKSEQATSRKRKWYLYNTMSFLIPYYYSRETDGCLMYPDEDYQQVEEADIDEAASEPSPASLSSEESFPRQNFRKPQPQQSRKRKKDCDAASHFNMELLKALKKPEIVDENELFFKSLLPSLKKLNDIQAMEFRLEVQSLLLKYLIQSVQPPTAVASTSGYVSSQI